MTDQAAFRLLGTVVMGVTAVLAVAFGAILVAEYLAPTIQAIEAIGR